MAVTINKKVWVLVERLYIFIYKENSFLEFLKSHNIQYENEAYKSFNTIKGQYTFMSEDNYDFSECMSLVPTYKYIDILKPIIFDKSIIETKDDNWNYYGEFIKNWYPDLIDLLKLAGFIIDYEKELFYLPEDVEDAESQDFLPMTFSDIFLDYIRKEINEAYERDLFLSTMFLSRKIIEAVIIRIYEVVFPKIINKTYSEVNHSLWYDKNRGSNRNLDILLENLKENATSFHEDKDLIIQVVTLIKPFKNETNVCVHNDYKIPDSKYIETWKIPYIIGVVHKLFKKYCNP